MGSAMSPLKFDFTLSVRSIEQISFAKCPGRRLHGKASASARSGDLPGRLPSRFGATSEQFREICWSVNLAAIHTELAEVQGRGCIANCVLLHLVQWKVSHDKPFGRRVRSIQQLYSAPGLSPQFRG